MARWFDPLGRLTAEQVTQETIEFILGGLLQENSTCSGERFDE